MTELSARFALPLLVPGQAQKEMFHNEALTLVDAVMHAAVEGRLAVPPSSPTIGRTWIVDAGASGAWAGRDDRLAIWTAGGWRFVAPPESMIVWDKAVGFARRWTGSAWTDGSIAVARIVIGGQQIVGTRQAAPPSPSGGTTIDTEARAAIAAITVALRTHGLIE
jgi:hypothetical protein